MRGLYQPFLATRAAAQGLGLRVILALLLSMATVGSSLINPPSAEAAVGVWSTPVTLNAGPDGYGGGDASKGRVAVSADGSKAFSVFTRRKVTLSGQYDILQFSRSSDGGVTWSVGTDLSDWGYYADEPQIVSSTDGTKLAVVWVSQAYPTFQVKVITSSNSGTSWSTATSLSPWGKISTAPDLAMSTDGSRMTVVWQQYDGTSTTSVQSKSSTDSGVIWSASATSLSVGSADGPSPQVASSSDGTKLTVVWRMKSGTSHMVQSRYSTDSGATWLPTIDNPNNVIGADGPATPPQIVSSTNGAKVTAIWTVKVTGSSNYRVQTRSSTDYGATWGGSIPFLSDTGQDAANPQITSSSNGTNLTAVWTRSNGSYNIVQTSASTNSGVTWGSAVDLTDTGKSAAAPQIFGSSDGTKLTVAWNRPSTNGYQAVQSRASADSGATWSTAIDVSNSISAQNYDARLDGSSDGSVVAAVWFKGAGSTAYSTVQASAVSTLLPGLTPTFGSATRTADGFTVPISNYDAAYGWAASVPSSSASVSGSTVTVTGLSAGASATVTVSTTRSGYSSGSATSTGQALSAQSVTWSPTTAVTVPASPLTPSVLASALGAADISYAVTSAGTTGCTVAALTGVVTYSAAGSCTVRATAAATSAYAAGTKDVTFTVTLAAQTVTWSPTTAVTVPASPLTPSVLASALGGADISYAVTSAGTTGCTVTALTGVVTYSAAGSCTVRATAAATVSYAEGTKDVTFTITNAASGLAWAPVASLTATSGSAVLAAATATSPNAISYAVTSAGTTGCSIDSASRTLTYSGQGSCEVTATIMAGGGYDGSSLVRTIAIARDTPTLTWSPDTSLSAANSPVTLASASTNSAGAITYAVSSDSGAGCSLASASSPVLTVATAGTCTITVSVAETDLYSAATSSAVFTVTLATPTLTWSPASSLMMPSATVNPVAATSTSSGAITYVVTSDSGAGCSVVSATGALTYASAGQCQVTATSASTPRYASGSTAVIFTVSLAPQVITATATSTSLVPGGNSVISYSGTSGTGLVTMTVTSGLASCAMTAATVQALADGTCVVTVAIASDANYSSASTTVTFTVATPPSPAGGGGSGGSGSGSATPSHSGSHGDEGPVSAQVDDDSVMIPAPPGSPESAASMGASSSAGRKLPPAPSKVDVRRVEGTSKAQVVVTLPSNTAKGRVDATVVVVRDASGKVVARLSVKVKQGEGSVAITVPLIADGYTVSVYNVNDVGVSTGALVSSSLVHARTITRRDAKGVPVLFGTRLGKPIIFTAASAFLDARDKAELDRIAKEARGSSSRIFVTGFARRGGGTPSELAAISTQRARAVALYLSARGVRVWIRYWGVGSLHGTGQPADRRVEIRQSSNPIPRILVR